MRWIVYIIECRDQTLYTGITTDIAKRLQSHRKGTASKYTRARLPIRLVYKEGHPSRRSALRREVMIKEMKRSDKLDLIRSSSPSTR
ncbi:MAG: GIY-YIG nuclease family protein [Candidatus Krumholzibacteria bacterium]|nr:GIY-YIG nuclease family protein [Candidatus Krumholzibacteria bacterium]